MRARWCTECRARHDEGKHFPLFLVEIAEIEDDEWLVIRARDAQSAAEQACEQHDQDSVEYTIIKNGGTGSVRVKDSDGNMKRFSVIAEAYPSYYATEIGDENEKGEG